MSVYADMAETLKNNVLILVHKHVKWNHILVKQYNMNNNNREYMEICLDRTKIDLY